MCLVDNQEMFDSFFTGYWTRIIPWI